MGHFLGTQVLDKIVYFCEIKRKVGSGFDGDWGTIFGGQNYFYNFAILRYGCGMEDKGG